MKRAAYLVAFAAFSSCAPSQTVRQVSIEDYLFEMNYRVTSADLKHKKPREEYAAMLVRAEELIARDPGSAKGYDLAGGAYYSIWMFYSHKEADALSAAENMKKAAELDPSDEHSLIGLADLMCRFGNHKAELEYIDAAIKAEHNDPGLHYMRAGALQELGLVKEALKEKEIADELSIAVKQNDSVLEEGIKGWARSTGGGSHPWPIPKGEETTPSRSITIDYAYFRKHPLTPLDNALKKPLAQYLDNISLGEKMIAAKPDDNRGYSIVGGAYYYIWVYYSRDIADLEKSITMLRKNIEVDPSDLSPHMALSMIYCELGEHGEELLEIERAIGKNPSDIGFHRYRAGCLRELGRENEAQLGR